MDNKEQFTADIKLKYLLSDSVELLASMLGVNCLIESEHLSFILSLLSSNLLDQVMEERTANQLCANPACPKSIKGMPPKPELEIVGLKLIRNTLNKQFCSPICENTEFEQDDSSPFYVSQIKQIKLALQGASIVGSKWDKEAIQELLKNIELELEKLNHNEDDQNKKTSQSKKKKKGNKSIFKKEADQQKGVEVKKVKFSKELEEVSEDVGKEGESSGEDDLFDDEFVELNLEDLRPSLSTFVIVSDFITDITTDQLYDYMKGAKPQKDLRDQQSQVDLIMKNIKKAGVLSQLPKGEDLFIVEDTIETMMTQCDLDKIMADDIDWSLVGKALAIAAATRLEKDGNLAVGLLVKSMIKLEGNDELLVKLIVGRD